MSRERVLRRRLRSLKTLTETVEAMRSLAAGHLRAARGALPTAREYHAGVERAVTGVPLPAPKSGAQPGWLVVASDLGLCGTYNSSIARAFLAERAAGGDGPVYCVGRRVTNALTRAGLHPERVYGSPVSVAGLTNLVLTLAQDLLGLYYAGAVAPLYVVYARFEGVGKFTPVRTQVLPIAPPRGPAQRAPALRPSPYVTSPHLASVAVRELLFIQLYELLLDALASEHGARLVSTEAARRWLDRESTVASRALRAVQRETATQEVLDIAAGTRLQLRRQQEAES